MASFSDDNFCSFQDLLKSCGEALGSIGGAERRFYIAPKSIGAVPQFATDVNGNQFVNDITFAANTEKFSQIDAVAETVGLTAPVVGMQAAAAKFIDQTVAFSRSGLKNKDVNFLVKLATEQPVMIIMETRSPNETDNGNQWVLVGYPNGLILATGDGGPRVAKTDLAGYDFTLTAPNKVPFYPIVPDSGTYPTFLDFLTAICKNPVAV